MRREESRCALENCVGGPQLVEHVGEQSEVIAVMLGEQLPTVETMLRDAREDLLAFTIR